MDGELRLQVAAVVNATAAHLLQGTQHTGYRLLDAQGEYSRRLGELMALGDLLGRRRLLLEANSLKTGQDFELMDLHDLQRAFMDPKLASFALLPGSELVLFATELATAVPKVPFKDAIRDLTRRDPRLASSAAEVSQIYAEHGFAAVHASSDVILERVRQQIASVMAGSNVADVIAVVQALEGWTRNYAGTVVRTNLTTAYAAGRWEQLKDPDVRQTIPALRYVSVQEPWDPKTKRGTRPNHRAAHGFVAAPDDPAWKDLAPPLGYG